MNELKSPKQLEATLQAIAKYQENIRDLRVTYAAKVAKLEAELAAKLNPWQQNIDDRIQAVASYAVSHDDLYKGGKTVNIGMARLGFRKTPIAVTIHDETEFVQLVGTDCPFIFERPYVDKSALKHSYQLDPDNKIFRTAMRKGLLSFTGGSDEFFIKIGDETWKPY